MIKPGLLSEERVAHYTAVEATNEEYLKPEQDQRPWVLGKLAYRDRIAEIVEWCFGIWPGDCLEIGCYGGATTVRMVEIAQKYDRTVLGVDPYIGRTDFWNDHLAQLYPQFMKTSEPWRNAGRFIFLKGRSQSEEARCFVDEHAPYAFAFVDGDHRYNEVLSDLRLVLPRTDGVICLDDWFLQDVREATVVALAEFKSWHIALEVKAFGEIYLMRSDVL
jgi:hypothetical protein